MKRIKKTTKLSLQKNTIVNLNNRKRITYLGSPDPDTSTTTSIMTVSGLF
jgi:hypothetical protein